MNYRNLFVYFCVFFTGILQTKLFFSFIISIFVIFMITNINLFLISLLFLIGYFLGKYFLLIGAVFFTGTGFVEHKTHSHLYLTNISANRSIPSNLYLKNRNNSDEFTKVKTGDIIKFSGMTFGSNNGTLTKIHDSSFKNLTFVQKIRISIQEFLKKSEFYGFLQSIIIGDKSEITTIQSEILKIGGLWHLVAISGLHLSVIVLNLFKYLKKLFSLSFWLNYNFNTRLISAVIAFIIGYFYIKISLFPISAIRALILTSSNMFFENALSSKKITLLSAFIMLIISPNLAFDMSFQLSFLCTWILINRQGILFLNLSIIPILKQFNIVSLLLNMILVPFFIFILFFTLISLIFQSFYILKITDFL